MELVSKLVSVLFPSRCLLCQQTVVSSENEAAIDLCDSCFQALPVNLNACQRCALPLADDIEAKVLCGRCITRLPEFDYAHSLFRYEEDVVTLVQQLKFSEKISCARSIGEMLLSACKSDNSLQQEKPDCLLPVPLHSSRLKQRGFNQSIEITRLLAKRLNIKLEYDAVIRQRSTLAQTGLSAKKRRKNIKGAFSLSKNIPYKHVLIIDDVVTTGSTVNELAGLLKKNGVARVGVLSIARAPVKA
jgi:ComF family protein